MLNIQNQIFDRVNSSIAADFSPQIIDDNENLTDNIPKELIELELGKELTIEKEESKVAEPLFKNKAWLWVVMSFIILLLGWFTLKMIRK